MLVTFECWLLEVGDKNVGEVWDKNVGDRIKILVTSFGSWCSTLMIEDVDDRNSKKHHQHLRIVTNIFRLQRPSPTSIWPFSRSETVGQKLNHRPTYHHPRYSRVSISDIHIIQFNIFCP